MTIAAYLAACDRMVRDGYFYDNDVPSRCNPPPYKGRDCSTFVAEALIEGGYPNIDPCGNSEYFARMCYDQPRPDWFTERFGPGVGTFITHDQSHTVVCWGLEGQDYGREAWPGNRAHIETSLGNGGGSVGAHSHATGVGYSTFDLHNLDYYAVPPQFLAEMAPPSWKVQPMFLPSLQLAARLRNPRGGWWEGYEDGRVDLLKPNGQIVHGGMIGTDAAAFTGRRLAQLRLRWYRPKGALRRRAGYTIVATSGEKYEPTPQH